MNRRKELKEQYKNMKPDMGVFIIRSNSDDKCYIEATQDLKSTINSTKFKLELGFNPNKEFQKEWKKHGGAVFSIEILEKLKYYENESKEDYSEELNILKMLWEDRLLENGMKFYNK